jgi:hypothetical protein
VGGLLLLAIYYIYIFLHYLDENEREGFASGHTSIRLSLLLFFFESVVPFLLLAMSQKLYGSKPVVETPPLSANIVRNLSDKLYEKRKMGALELEQLIRDSKDAKDTEKINTIINFITSQFALSSSGNQRKGGLIALAATAIGLGAVHLSRSSMHVGQPR